VKIQTLFHESKLHQLLTYRIKTENKTMTTCTLTFAVPPERLGHDAIRYMEPEIGPTWPQEAHEVVLNDLKPELQNSETQQPLMKQLDTRGFAILKNKSKTLGSLESQGEWNSNYLEVSLQKLLSFLLTTILLGDSRVCTS
jgi:hypothetical protein